MAVGQWVVAASLWYRLLHGYQQLPERLAQALTEAGVSLRMGCPLERVERSPDLQGFLISVVSQ